MLLSVEVSKGSHNPLVVAVPFYRSMAIQRAVAQLPIVMKFLKDQDGTWSLKIETDAEKAPIGRSHASYLEALPRYLTAFELPVNSA
jgi:hypothetical protein